MFETFLGFDHVIPLSIELAIKMSISDANSSASDSNSETANVENQTTLFDSSLKDIFGKK